MSQGVLAPGGLAGNGSPLAHTLPLAASTGTGT